jgi:hypothetical protein
MKIAQNKSITPSLKILNEIFETDYNGVLVNEYKDGNYYIEKHRDSKKMVY